MEMNSEDLARMNKVLRHRLRNTASGIKSAATLLSKELEDTAPPSVLEYFPLITKECDDLAELTRRLSLLFDRPPDGGPRRVEALAQILADRIGRKYPRSEVVIDCDAAAGARTVAAADSVLAALLEIVENAVEAGGNAPVECEWRSGGDLVTFRTRSHGEPPEDCERIFLPFYTSRSRHAGMGLAIARRLLAPLGGTVTADLGDDAALVVDVVMPDWDRRKAI